MELLKTTKRNHKIFESRVMSCICAIFDLEDFTSFCKRIDPQFPIPIFLNEYLKWAFKKLEIASVSSAHTDGADAHDLPILIKFMGDGLLVLWETKRMTPIAQRNIVISMYNIANSYAWEFLPTIRRKVTEPPARLRCSIAKGNVHTIGDGTDVVGPCINLAAKLQRMLGINFAFSTRGLAITDEWLEENLHIFQKIQIRGMPSGELICVDKKSFGRLDEKVWGLYGRPLERSVKIH